MRNTIRYTVKTWWLERKPLPEQRDYHLQKAREGFQLAVLHLVRAQIVADGQDDVAVGDELYTLGADTMKVATRVTEFSKWLKS